jgi:hypothetical protein
LSIIISIVGSVECINCAHPLHNISNGSHGIGFLAAFSAITWRCDERQARTDVIRENLSP